MGFSHHRPQGDLKREKGPEIGHGTVILGKADRLASTPSETHCRQVVISAKWKFPAKVDTCQMEMSRNVDIAIRQVENSAKCLMGPIWSPKLANCQKSPTAKTRQLSDNTYETQLANYRNSPTVKTRQVSDNP